MSSFTPLVKKKYTFEDDNVTVIFARIKRKHIMKLLPKLIFLADDSDDLAGKNEVLNDAMSIMPEYIKSIDGLTGSDNEAISKETVFDDMYFAELASQITLDMLEESMPMMGEERKNA